MLFWIISLALAAILSATLIRAYFRAGGTAGNADLQVYRDQLAEIDRDAARGVIDESEAERTRIEISRRILEADRASGAAETAGRGSLLFPAILIGAAVAGAAGLYLRLGAPGYPDLPISERIARAEAFKSDRPSQAEAESQTTLPLTPEPDAAYAELIGKLRIAVADNPADPTGQRLLARNEAGLGNYAAAAEAQRKLIELLGAEATASDYATLADIYVLATAGYVSPEAEAALKAALERDPKNGTARFYTGLMWAQTGRPDLAFRFWRPLLEEGPEEAPWIAPIRSQIDLVARAAGVDYTPPSAKGPDAADIAAASEMSSEDRQAMIRNMVDGLADRLATEGGPAEEWARLISSLVVLGEVERAKAIWTNAQGVFAEHPEELEKVRAAAVQAGLAE
ncbi:c-type cytochrome biogenesis protein CcmI [Defluviimonas sp. WL0050]|uniref:C-type cytochrome biogenesis protein CcmI n=1 Tax=Albidovulum litorale TaxID=2984134 RepID=A0ABT2ZPA5_9RHOB|nr:c-type cytochrome biogenesis protein CcmI [Defluviimonas sp. WL0050]MCV2872966.1 c-type cytochrome biogenesis protein CcmI [Defluviimonas sp. WL0050]